MPFSAYYHKPDLLEIQLAVSRDGINWERPGDRQPWIGMPFDEEGVYQLYAAPGVVRNGNALYHYHNAIFEHHGYNAPGKYEKAKAPEYACQIRRGELRLDGYMSADAGNLECDFVTPPIIHNGKRLELNVDTSAGGYVEVELLNVHGRVKWGYRLEGYTLADCDRIVCNSTHRVVTWKGNSDVSSLARKPVRMHVRMRNAKLYAFQFAGDE